MQERLASRTLAILRDAQAAEIGARMAKARLEAGMKRPELAKALGHRDGGRLLGYWENGGRDPRPHVKDVVDALKKAHPELRWTVKDVLYGPAPESPTEVESLRALVERLERGYDELTREIVELRRQMEDGPRRGEGSNGG